MAAVPPDNILVTKLQPPLLRPRLVARPHLIDKLNDSLNANHRLILVAAPAGYGKTTLLAEWLSGTPAPVAWLTLDGSDNEPARFLSHLIASLTRSGLQLSEPSQRLLRGARPPTGPALIGALINDLSQLDGRLVLVLDDYQVIVTPTIHEQIDFLLAHQPAQLALVVATREDPPFPLARLRARGQMTDIRQRDLRFSAAEAAEFLRHAMGLTVSDADVSALAHHTEGWIAGLQLAALSMQGRRDLSGFVQSFTGSSRYVLDYLFEEVFSQQTPAIQAFLLQTSILAELSGEVCDAVTGRGDSHLVLPALEHANLFLIPLDQSCRRYRYHRLFADLLGHKLGTQWAPEAVADLHLRASRWYETTGDTAGAIRHSLAASRWQRALGLIESVSDAMLKRGEVVTLLDWLQALPEDTVAGRPELAVDMAWCLVLTGRLDQAERFLERPELTPARSQATRSDLATLRAHICRFRGDDPGTIAHAEEALRLIPAGDHLRRSVVDTSLGIAYWNVGNLAEAERVMREVVEASGETGNLHSGTIALALLGRIEAARGNLHGGAGVIRQALQAAGDAPAAAFPHLELGAILLEWNELEAAREHTLRGIEASEELGSADFQVAGYRALARIEQARGDTRAASHALEEGHRLARLLGVSPTMIARLAACHARVALARRDLETARVWAAQVPQNIGDSRFYQWLGLTRIRILLAEGQTEEAMALLAPLADLAGGSGCHYGLLEIRILQASAAPTAAQEQQYLAEALRLGEPGNFIQAFAEKGERLAPLLAQAISAGTISGYPRRLMEVFQATALTAPSAGSERLAHSGPQRPLPVEPLTDREREVVALLAAGLTYHEIARDLVISLNTTKTHLKHIYGKLGVNNRREAVAAAETLDLV